MVGFIVIFGVLFLIWFPSYYKEKTSPYFRLKKNLDRNYKYSANANDWRKMQNIKLELLWLETIKKIKKLNNRNYDDFEIKRELIKLPYSSVILPHELSVGSNICYVFATDIIAMFQKTIEYQSEFGTSYIEEYKLPLPKNYIEKCIEFMMKYIEYDKAYYKLKNKEEILPQLIYYKTKLSHAAE